MRYPDYEYQLTWSAGHEVELPDGDGWEALHMSAAYNGDDESYAAILWRRLRPATEKTASHRPSEEP